MFKMTFEISNLRKVLSKLKDADESIVYTEHYFEKIAHRNIDEAFVNELILNSQPDGIMKIPHSSQKFRVSFGLGDDELVVIVHLYIPKKIVLLSAFLKNGGKINENR